MNTRSLDAFALEHHGLITRRAAGDLGMSRATWFRAVADGRLEVVHPGVARLPGSARTREQAICAAVLATSPGSLASHRSAAYLWGVPRPDDDPVDVVVTRRTRTPELSGVLVHRPRDLKDLKPVLRQNIRTTNVLRLLCDLGAVDPAAVSNAVGHVVTTRLASPVALRAAIDRHSRRGRHGVPAFRAALEEWVIDGKPVDSVLETAMHRLLRDHRLPPAEFHAKIIGYEVDFWIVGTPVVLECDGWEFHAKTRVQQEADATRDAELAAAGYITVRFAFRPMMRRPDALARRIRKVVRRWAPHLDLGAENPRSETLRAQMRS
jgi:very-short-patch-repair endonuclease